MASGGMSCVAGSRTLWAVEPNFRWIWQVKSVSCWQSGKTIRAKFPPCPRHNPLFKSARKWPNLRSWLILLLHERLNCSSFVIKTQANQTNCADSSQSRELVPGLIGIDSMAGTPVWSVISLGRTCSLHNLPSLKSVSSLSACEWTLSHL